MFKQKFNQLLFSILAVSLICLVLVALPLGFAFNTEILRLSALITALLLIPLNWPEIVYFYEEVLPSGSKKKKHFLTLSVANVILIFLFIIGFALFKYGSPLIYEQPVAGFRKAREKWLVNKEVLTQQFTAVSDNLGAVNVRLAVKEKRVKIENGQVQEVVVKPLSSDFDLTLDDLGWLKHHLGENISFHYPDSSEISLSPASTSQPQTLLTIQQPELSQAIIEITPLSINSTPQDEAERAFDQASSTFPEDNLEPYQFEGFFHRGWRTRKKLADDLAQPLIIDTAFIELDNQLYQLELRAEPDSYQTVRQEFETILASFQTAEQGLVWAEAGEADEQPNDALLAGMDDGLDAIDDELEPSPLLAAKPVEIEFRIKEKGKDDWLAVNQYYFDHSIPLHHYPFGFPVQPNSEDKTYVFEIRAVEPQWLVEWEEMEADVEDSKELEELELEQELQALGVFVETDRQEGLNYATRFVFRRGEILDNAGQIMRNFGRNVSGVVTDSKYWVNIVAVFVLLEVVIYSVLSKDEEGFKRKVVPVLSYVFLILLTLVTIASLDFEFLRRSAVWNLITGLKQFNWVLVVSVIGFGGLSLWLNRDDIEQKVIMEEEQERAVEEQRVNQFEQKYPKLSKVWLLGSLSKWFYKEGWVNLLILFSILAMFTIVKAPYFGVSFTGEHTMKYNSHVEPAKYMYERNDPFWMQQKYQANPITNPQGIFPTFSSPPFMEWGLLTTFYLFPHNTLELNTRLFTHSLGISILLLVYIFFGKWFSKRTALIICFLMAINPIINFLSFVTVLDSWAIIFAFTSLTFFTDFINTRKSSALFFAGLFFGIGSVVKYSVFLWLFPITLLILVFNLKRKYLVIKSLGIMGFLSLTTFATHFTSIRNLPSDATLSLLKFLFWVFFSVGAFIFLSNFDNKINLVCQKLLEKKLILFGTVLGAIIIAILFISFSGVMSLSNEFLTDSTIIFNIRMYEHMLNQQFKSYMTANVFYLGIVGFVTSFFLMRKRRRAIILLSFLLGSLAYWVLASKSIFFHNYYTGIIMVTFIIAIVENLSALLYIFKRKIYFYMLLLLFTLIILPGSIRSNIERISRERDIKALQSVANYIIEHTKQDDFYFDDSFLLTLTFLTGRPRGFLPANDYTRNLVEKDGFSSTLAKYSIRFFITEGEQPNFVSYANLFSADTLQTTAYRRNDIILSRIDPNHNYYQDIELRKKIVEIKTLEEKFILEKEIGSFKIFSFVN